MSEDTVKPALTPKRGKRVVENTEFSSFTGRVLRAYARRVAAGDVEALRQLVSLRAEVDTATRTAVGGLRAFGYSWSEIADRLGVSRQAVQMRFGQPAERGALDRRLLDAGLGVTVATLVEVFADHHPGVPPVSVCPGCGFSYPTTLTDCPTNTFVRPLLYERRSQDPEAVNRLSPVQFADLHDRTAARRNRLAVKQAARPAPCPDREEPTLLDLLDGKGVPA